jgi:Helix-turn-helix domain
MRALSSSERRSAEFWCSDFKLSGEPKLDRKENETRKPLSDEILTAEEVATFLRIHPSTICRLANRGDLPVSELGLG